MNSVLAKVVSNAQILNGYIAAEREHDKKKEEELGTKPNRTEPTSRKRKSWLAQVNWLTLNIQR